MQNTLSPETAAAAWEGIAARFSLLVTELIDALDRFPETRLLADAVRIEAIKITLDAVVLSGELDDLVVEDDEADEDIFTEENFPEDTFDTEDALIEAVREDERAEALASETDVTDAADLPMSMRVR